MVNEVRRDQMKIGETGVSSIWGIIAADFKSTPPVSDVQEITYPVIPDKYRLMPIIKEEAPPLVEGKYYQVEILTESKGVSTFSDSVEVDFQILNGQIKTFRRVCKFRENGQPVIKECSPGCPDDVEVEGQLMQYACGSSGD